MHRTSQRTLGALVVMLAVTIWATPRDTYAEEPEADIALDEEPKPETSFGLGVRLRQVHIPASLIELFVERSGGGGSHTGIGAELIRQTGNFVITFGVEYEKISPQDGVYIEKGQSIPQDPVDFVSFDDFAWVGVDATFLWQQPLIGKVLSLRYGAGLGVGYILGEVRRTDYLCTSDDPTSCGRDPNAMLDNTPEDSIPPVFPIVNVIVGAQIRPVGSLAINIEGGIRTLPFFGTSLAYMF